MPWNQPSGPQSPWGRRPGGPDLDERLKSWQRWLESFLKTGGRGGDSGSLLVIALVFAVAIWLWTGVYQVKQPERGVVQRFGRYIETTPPGLHFRIPWPVESVSIVNVASVNSSDFKSRVLTSDVNLVELTRRTKELIQSVLNYYNAGITVTTVNLEDVQVPDAVVPSQRDANKAQADKERLILEAEAYKNGILPVAKGAAARILQDAQGYKSQVMALAEGQAARFLQLEAAYSQAPEVTRRRLYTDTIENVLARSHKVIIDSHAGNNLVYLPIEKLLEKSVNREPELGSEPAAGSSAKDSEQVTIEGSRSRGER